MFRNIYLSRGDLPRQLQLRGEIFNLTNTPHFGNPDGNVNSSTFGQILNTEGDNAMGRSRQFRFGLRLSF